MKSTSLIDYQTSFDWMHSQVKQMHDGKGNEIIWLLEHNDIYTGGTSSKKSDLKNAKNIKVAKTNRGGQWTWHGPGQRIAYFVLDLNKRNKDVRWFVNQLEQLIINTLSDFNINSTRRENFPGVWVQNSNSFNKIGAIGIRISKWIAYHGISININPDLAKYEGIIPCGVTDAGVTSASDLGYSFSLKDFDNSLALNFEKLF